MKKMTILALRGAAASSIIGLRTSAHNHSPNAATRFRWQEREKAGACRRRAE